MIGAFNTDSLSQTVEIMPSPLQPSPKPGRGEIEKKEFLKNESL